MRATALLLLTCSLFAQTPSQDWERMQRDAAIAKKKAVLDQGLKVRTAWIKFWETWNKNLDVVDAKLQAQEEEQMQELLKEVEKLREKHVRSK